MTQTLQAYSILANSPLWIQEDWDGNVVEKGFTLLQDLLATALVWTSWFSDFPYCTLTLRMGTKYDIDKSPQKVSHQKSFLLCYPSCKGVLRTASRSERGAYLFYAILIRKLFKNIFIVKKYIYLLWIVLETLKMQISVLLLINQSNIHNSTFQGPWSLEFICIFRVSNTFQSKNYNKYILKYLSNKNCIEQISSPFWPRGGSQNTLVAWVTKQGTLLVRNFLRNLIYIIFSPHPQS